MVHWLKGAQSSLLWEGDKQGVMVRVGLVQGVSERLPMVWDGAPNEDVIYSAALCDRSVICFHTHPEPGVGPGLSKVVEVVLLHPSLVFPVIPGKMDPVPTVMIHGKEASIEVPHDYDSTVGELSGHHVGHVLPELVLQVMVRCCAGHVHPNDNEAGGVPGGGELGGYHVTSEFRRESDPAVGIGSCNGVVQAQGNTSPMLSFLDTCVHEGVTWEALRHNAPMLTTCPLTSDFGFSEDKDLCGFFCEAVVEKLVLLGADTPDIPGGQGEGGGRGGCCRGSACCWRG